MDAKIKADWLAALRSGKYAQTTGALREETILGDHTYCCLGVLCEVVGVTWTPEGCAAYKEDVCSGLLPHSVALKAGLDASVEDYEDCQQIDPEVWIGEEKATLSELNDSGDYTFAQIADIIEEQL